MKANLPLNKILRSLCTQFDTRQRELGLKGRARDRAALEFFIGAAAAFTDGSSRQRAVAHFAVFGISQNGFKAVSELLERKYDKDETLNP